jgi:hypothetical protein
MLIVDGEVGERSAILAGVTGVDLSKRLEVGEPGSRDRSCCHVLL